MVKILLLRHGESRWNSKFMKWQQEQGIGPGQFVMPSHKFAFEVNDISECDSQLTEDGKTQCYEKAVDLDHYPNIKKVLCSPLRRTIQTFELMFKNYPTTFTKEEISIIPCICEQILSSGEFAIQTDVLREKYQDQFNWEAMDGFVNGPLWFIENVPSNAQNSGFKNELLANWAKTQDFGKLINFWRDSEKCLDNNQALEERILKAKAFIRKFIVENNLADGELVLVTHWKFIKHFTAQSFDKDGESTDGKSPVNCELVEYDLI